MATLFRLATFPAASATPRRSLSTPSPSQPLRAPRVLLAFRQSLFEPRHLTSTPCPALHPSPLTTPLPSTSWF